MAMLSFQACTLDEDTSGISNPDDFFRKFSECQSVVNGCYIPIKSIYTYTYMIATECVTDIAYCPSGTLDASLDISPAVPRMGSTVWRNGYLGVQRCNFAVNGIERAYKNEVISEEQYHQLLCEAKTLRAFFYWTLTCFFGNVHRRPSVDSSPRRPNPHLRQRGQSSGSLLRLHAHRQDGHVEQAVGRGAGRAGADRNDLRSAVAVRLRREYPVPEQEHPGVDHGNSAHLHPGRPYLHVQRGLHLPALPACGQFGGLRRRGDSRTGRPGDRLVGDASERLFQPGSPVQNGQGHPRQVQHGMGIRGQDVQQHQHPPVVRTEILVSEHAGLERRQQLQGLPLCRRAADDGRVLFLQGKLRKGGRIPRHDPHARQSVQVHLPCRKRLP